MFWYVYEIMEIFFHLKLCTKCIGRNYPNGVGLVRWNPTTPTPANWQLILIWNQLDHVWNVQVRYLNNIQTSYAHKIEHSVNYEVCLFLKSFFNFHDIQFYCPKHVHKISNISICRAAWTFIFGKCEGDASMFNKRIENYESISPDVN